LVQLLWSCMPRLPSTPSPCGPGLRRAGVERSRATDAASSEGTGTPAGPLGLLSRVATRLKHGAGHSAWPNTSHVINAWANSMRNGVAGSTRLKDCASQQLRQLGDIRRDPPRLCRMYAGRGLNCCDVATEQHRPQICGMVVFVAGSTALVAITVAGGGFQW